MTVLLRPFIPYLIGAGVLLCAGLAVLYYGHTRYVAGVSDTRSAIVKQIADSKELKDDEARKASSAATVAARRVCEQAGVPLDDCDGL